MENGPRARVRAQSRWVRQAWFEPNALLMLQPGEWVLEWDLDDRCSCEIVVSTAAPRGQHRLAYALNSTVARDAPPAALTDLAAHKLQARLSPLRRHQLAVLFAHLIDDRPPPANLCAAAGQRLDLTEDQVRRMAYKVRDKLNSMRPAKITTLDDLGHYLVITSQEIGPDDLCP